jgi:hypothetical protein
VNGDSLDTHAAIEVNAVPFARVAVLRISTGLQGSPATCQRYRENPQADTLGGKTRLTKPN